LPAPEKSSPLARIELDVPNERLLWGQRAIALTPKAFLLLRALVERPNQLLTTDELLAAGWSGVVVEEGQVRQFIGELRRLLSDDPLAPRFIETVRGRGYRFVGDIALRGGGAQRGVAADEPSALSSRAVEPPSPIFGRGAELARLNDAFSSAAAGHRQLVFIGGEAGIGKSAMVDTFLAQLPPSRIARGECVEQHGAGEPYLPVLEAVGRLCRQAGGQDIVALLRRRAPIWLLQLPGLLGEAEHAALQRRVAGSGVERMLREMVEAIEAIAATEPLVLVFEDMHWSDRSTVNWLAMLACRREAAQLLVVVTSRPVLDHPLRTLQQELSAHGLGMGLQLGRLPADAVHSYVEQRLPGRADELAPALYQRSLGHPLFMVHVADELQRTGSAALPGGLRELIEAQLGRLSLAQQQALEAASVAGAEFAAACVAAALQEEPEQTERTFEALAQREQFIEARGLAEWHDGTFSGRYAFRHDLHRETLYTRLGAARRAQWHARIGERLELAHGERAAEIATELAVHFEQGRDAARAARYRRAAGETALGRHAYDEALEHVEKGLALLAAHSPGARRDRAELQLRLTQGAVLLPIKGFSSTVVEEVYLRARTLCVQLDDSAALAPVLAGLWNVRMTRTAFAPARAAADQLEALARQRSDPAVAMVAGNAIAQSLLLTGEPAPALAHAETVLALYDSGRHRSLAMEYGEDPGVIAGCVAALTSFTLGYPSAATRHLERGLELARSLDSPFSVVQQLWVDGRTRLEAGDLERLEATTDELLSLCTDNDFPVHRAGGRMLRAAALARRGRLAEARALAEQGLSEWRGLWSLFLPYQLAVTATIHAMKDHVADALTLLDEALAMTARSGERWYEPELHRLQGEAVLRQPDAGQARAEASFMRAIELARQQQARMFELRATTSLARLKQLQGNGKAARPMLSAIYGWFDEESGTRDLAEAAALLDLLK
jgi:DNA-binding winged helix-turn-helix (wHTH) protein/predicted ATPase